MASRPPRPLGRGTRVTLADASLLFALALRAAFSAPLLRMPDGILRDLLKILSGSACCRVKPARPPQKPPPLPTIHVRSLRGKLVVSPSYPLQDLRLSSVLSLGVFTGCPILFQTSRFMDLRCKSVNHTQKGLRGLREGVWGREKGAPFLKRGPFSFPQGAFI